MSATDTMGVENPHVGATLEQLEAEQKVSVNSKHLQSVQGIHAMAIFALPLIGTVYALMLGFQQGFRTIDLVLMLGMYSITMLGITVGFHRYFTHRSFKAGKGVSIFLAIIGSMSAQGSLMYWVSNHRRHHMYSDQPGDTHSPHVKLDKKLSHLEGLFYAQVGYTFSHTITNTLRFSKELYRDAGLRMVNSNYYVWVTLGLLIPTVIGGLWDASLHGAFMGFLWGGLVRLFFSYHFINSLNSFLHLYGKRDFNTNEHSHNNGWLAVPTFGEGWHNNHHAFPNSAKFGMKSGQMDMGWWMIRIMEKLHLVHDVRRPSDDMIMAKAVSLENANENP